MTSSAGSSRKLSSDLQKFSSIFMVLASARMAATASSSPRAAAARISGLTSQNFSESSVSRSQIGSEASSQSMAASIEWSGAVSTIGSSATHNSPNPEALVATSIVSGLRRFRKSSNQSLPTEWLSALSSAPKTDHITSSRS